MSSMAPTGLSPAESGEYPAQSGEGVAEPFTQLDEVIDTLAEEDLGLVPASGLGDDLRRLRSAIERIEAEFSRRLERFDRHQGYVPSGCCSAAGWLNEECRMTRSTAWERVRQARRLAELPATSAAFAAGDVNLEVRPETRPRPLASRRAAWAPEVRSGFSAAPPS